MTFQQQVQVVDEDVLKTLTSSRGFLIGYSIEEYPDMIFKSHYAVIKFINELPPEERKQLHDNEIIIYKNTISSKDTTFEDEYSAIKGEIIETEEYLQFDKKSHKWK